MKLITLLTESTPRTLYHGTTIDHLDSIRQHGLEPRIGHLTRAFYDMDDERLEPILFAADRNGLDKCVSAIAWHVGRLIGKRQPTLEDFAKYGLLCVFKHGEGSFLHHNDIERHEHFSQIEPRDYYREYNISPDFYLTGQKLVRFLEKNRTFFRNHYCRRNRNFPIRSHTRKDESTAPLNCDKMSVMETDLSSWITVWGRPDGKLFVNQGIHREPTLLQQGFEGQDKDAYAAGWIRGGLFHWADTFREPQIYIEFDSDRANPQTVRLVLQYLEREFHHSRGERPLCVFTPAGQIPLSDFRRSIRSNRK